LGASFQKTAEISGEYFSPYDLGECHGKAFVGGVGGVINHSDMAIRTLRKLRGLSLDELGRRARIERSRLSRAERGYLILSDTELERLAAELGVPLDSLIAPPPDAA
jgi:hypothetical protein